MENSKYIDLGVKQYFDDPCIKRQIYLHHTVSGNWLGTINHWQSDSNRVGAHIIITQSGERIVTMPINNWIHHLGLRSIHFDKVEKSSNNNILNQQSIAIELVNWGALTVENDNQKTKYINTYGRSIDIAANNIALYETPYRGFKAFEKYSNAQLDSLAQTIEWLCLFFNIPKFSNNAHRIFDICPDALRGEPGIFSHSSVRPDKSDCHPQPSLIQILNQL